MLFLCAMLEGVEVQCLVGDIKTKFMKVVIFKKQTFFFQDLNAKVMKVRDFNTNFPLLEVPLLRYQPFDF